MSTAPVVPKQSLQSFQPKGLKLVKIIIGSLDEPNVGVEAQYNPKELSLDHSVPWSNSKVKGQESTLEFTGGDSRSLTLELTFDGFESSTSVQKAIADLAKMAAVRDPKSQQDEMLRPHLVAVVWGNPTPTDTHYIPSFQGVIESIGTKYTQFLQDGTPVRAVATVKLKEAKSIQKAKAS